MAVLYLSNQSLFFPRLSTPSKVLEVAEVRETLTLKPLLLSRTYPHKRDVVLSLSFSFKSNRSRSFKSYGAIENPAPMMNDEETTNQDNVKALEKEADEKPSSSLKTLIEAYKDAILHGDEKTLSSIEARIYMLVDEKNELAQKVTDLSANISSGKEKYMRLQADFDNVRKRSEKESLATRSDAQEEVISSLLPIVDNFERAKQHIKPETDTEKRINFSYQGIYKQFVEIMRSLRVSVLATTGKPFDPLMHEAIAREECREFREGIVIKEVRRGFFFGDRLLRPAMVKVSSGPGRKNIASESGSPVPTAGVEER